MRSIVVAVRSSASCANHTRAAKRSKRQGQRANHGGDASWNLISRRTRPLSRASFLAHLCRDRPSEQNVREGQGGDARGDHAGRHERGGVRLGARHPSPRGGPRGPVAAGGLARVRRAGLVGRREVPGCEVRGCERGFHVGEDGRQGAVQPDPADITAAGRCPQSGPTTRAERNREWPQARVPR